jgi:tetratricopeptide (TPR) repeat protein
MVCEKEKNYTRSAALLESVPEVVDQQPDGWAALASAYYHTNRRKDAQSALRKLLGHSTNPRVAFLGGQVAMEGKDYPMAEALFSSIRSAYDDPAAAEYQIALAEYRDHRATQSEKTLLEAVQANRANKDCYLLLCQLLTEQGSGVRALQVATQASQAFPDSYEIVSVKASLEMKLQYFSQAASSYERAAKLNPKSSEAARNLATAEWRAGMRKQAANDFDQALREFPRDAAVPQIYGGLLLEDESPETRARAIELLKQAIALDSSSVEPKYQLANAELADGKPEQALTYLESAIKASPRDSRLHFALSRVYRRLGRSSEADREMEAYQKLKQAAQPAAPSDLAPGTQH